MGDLEGGNNKLQELGEDEKLLDLRTRASDEHQVNFSRNSNNNNNNNNAKIVLLFSALALSCLLVYHSTSYHALQFFSNSYEVPVTSTKHGKITSSDLFDDGKNTTQGNVSAKRTLTPSTDKKKQQSKLEKVLEKAAMDDKTVIITTLNAAWTAPNSIFDLFLKSFRVGNQTKPLLKHVVVAALDKTAYSRCLEKHIVQCYALTTEGVDFSGEAYFMSEDYLKMMWRRIDFLRVVLEMGYNFIFTDADIMWFRKPFAHFYPEADFQIACDHYWFDSLDVNNSPNGGFNYVKSNDRTVQFYKFWYNAREAHPGKHDQDVLNIIKYNPFIKDIGLSIRFLDTAFFGGFCEPSKDLNLVCTMHANCCIGLDKKIHDLKMALTDWRYYMSLPSDERTTKPQTWTIPRLCG